MSVDADSSCGSHRRNLHRVLVWIAVVLLTTSHFADAQAVGRHPLTVDDVLDTVALERAVASPDGQWIAAVVQRPAREGEVFGRNSYEVDPSRNDVWLISRRSGERRNLTRGGSTASGYWCATWSPDGGKLAMMSTQSEGREPRGGDNVRLYIWDRRTGRLARRSAGPLMTQTRYGSPLHQLEVRGGADRSTIARNCATNNENAPFTWLDERRLLAVTLPEGQTSALLDEYGRAFDHAATTRRALRDGNVPTATAVGSGAERVEQDARSYRAILRVIDADTGASETIAEVPARPFQGILSISVSPDGRQLAVMATTGAIQPIAGQRIPYNDDAWQIERRLGFVDIAAGKPVRWATLPPDARYPLELLGWSPDARAVAFRARAGFADMAAALFIAPADASTVEGVASPPSVGTPDAGPYPHEAAAIWVDARRLLVRGRNPDAARDDWWLIGAEGTAVNLTAGMARPPEAFRRTKAGRLITIADDRLIALDTQVLRLTALAGRTVPANASVAWPLDAERPSDAVLLATYGPDGRTLHRVSLNAEDTPFRTTTPLHAQVMDVDGDAILWRDPTRTGLFLRETRFDGPAPRDLMALDTHLASVDWGETRVIECNAVDGRPLKGAVILPPGYREGQRYPTVVWVYAGYQVGGADDPLLDPYMAGIYNLQLYAARGYVVLIPSIPLNRGAARHDSYPEIGNGVMPAIDRLAALGIADPTRVGIMGQSFGGYSVYSLVTQTKRFKAAVAVAGLTDLAQMHGQFDTLARGYPGIEHEKSANASINEVGIAGLGVPPYEDQARYWRNSPIAYVDRVETPLLLIHGEFDKRGAPSQAETFFYALYRQGKTARLLRYWGESHSLAQSPANVRDVLEETVRWFDRYLAGAAAESKPGTASTTR